MRYSKIDRRTFRDEKFRVLSDRAKLLFLYLLVSPYSTSLPGLIPVRKATIAEELGWTAQEFAIPYRELYAIHRMVEADWEAGLVWLCHGIHYNLPPNSKVLKGWESPWSELPNCKLKEKARTIFRQAIEKNRPEFLSIFDTVCPTNVRRYAKQNQNHMPSQEQEQEQEQYRIPLTNTEGTDLPFPRTKNVREKSKPTPTDLAAKWVCKELDLTGRDMRRVIRETIEQQTQTSTEDPETTAEWMVRIHRSYLAMVANVHPNYVYPPKAFFEQGVWKNSQLWKEHSNGGRPNSEQEHRRQLEHIVADTAQSSHEHTIDRSSEYVQSPAPELRPDGQGADSDRVGVDRRTDRAS